MELKLKMDLFPEIERKGESGTTSNGPWQAIVFGGEVAVVAVVVVVDVDDVVTMLLFLMAHD